MMERKPYYWQDREIELIKENHSRMSAIEMSKHINKQPPAIRWKLRTLGFTPLNKWSKKDLEFLKQNRLVLSFDDIAFHLKRTRSAVKCKCKQLRFVRPKYELDLNMSPELAYILGALCGDATILPTCIRLAVKDKEFADRFFYSAYNLLSPHYIKPIRFESKRVYYVCIGSLAFINLVKRYCDFQTKTWQVPQEIIDSNDEDIISSFLRGYYDSEGCFGNHSIRVQTICPSLEIISSLLLKLGIENKCVEVNRLTRAGNEVYELTIYREKFINQFRKKIGFTIKRKQDKLVSYLIKINNSKQKMLFRNKRRIANLYKEGQSLQQIATVFNIASPCVLTKHIKSVLGESLYLSCRYNKHCKVSAC